MKLKSLLFSVTLFTAVTAWADAPSKALIGGAALNEDTPAEMTRVNDNLFEAFAELLPGADLEIKDGDGNVLNLNGSKSVDTKGVYQIRANFDENSLSLKRIAMIAMKHCWTNKYFELDYVGNGVCAGTFNWGQLSNQDNRYMLLVRYMRDNDNDQKFTPAISGLDSEPDGTERYYQMSFAGQTGDQWGPKWKVASQYRDGQTHMVILTLRGETYTHSFGEIEANIPASLKIKGSAFDEGYSRDFAKVNETTFEIFTKLKPGNIEIYDADGKGYVINKDKIYQQNGSTSFDKSGVYCIYINFASGLATIKEVNSVKYYHLTSFGPQGDSLEYQSYGVWTGDVPVNSGDDRYRIEMYLDGVYQTWGAITKPGQKPSQANVGESYFNLVRVPWTFWTNEFKVEDNQRGQTLPLTVYLNANKYSHSFDAPVMTGIEDITVDENADAPVEYYNLQGVRVANPANGLYIKKQGNKTTKVIL